MTTDQWIALTSGVAALGACAMAYLTLREMAEQRRTTYRPHLVCESLDLQVYWTHDGSKVWIPSRWGEVGSSVPVTGRRANISLHNIGLGPLKELQVKWTPGSRSLVQSIVQMDTNRLLWADSYEGGWSTWSSAVREICDGEQPIDDLDTQVAHVLPVSVEREPTQIPIPRSAMLLLSALAHLDWKHRSGGRSLEPRVVEMGLELSYRDIGNNSHHQELSVRVEMDPILDASESKEASGGPECLFSKMRFAVEEKQPAEFSR